MKELSSQDAYELLLEAGKVNPGKWVKHSINAGKVAFILAEKLGLDADKAKAFGYIHDIGRREGQTAVRHIIDGYNYMKDMGYEEAARYCLTHSYMLKDVHAILGKWDMTEEETSLVKKYLENVEYTLYDKIIQISDYMALPNCFTLIERRFIDVMLRYGVTDTSVENAKTLYKIQAEIEEKLGYSMYKLFPEIEKNISEDLIKDILTF